MAEIEDTPLLKGMLTALVRPGCREYKRGLITSTIYTVMACFFIPYSQAVLLVKPHLPANFDLTILPEHWREDFR